MKRIWESIIKGYLRVIEPVAALLVKLRINPNVLTTVGTLCTVAGGIAFGMGHIRTAGWIIGLTAIFDVLDGTIARRTGQSTVFGAFYDSTLDRVADGVVLGGIAFFFVTSPVHHNLPMVVVSLLGIIGTFLVSYTRARAEGLGIDARVGVMQRPERVVLLSVPQAFFGLALNGWVLICVVGILTLTAWITAFQRILFVRRTALNTVSTPLRVLNDKSPPSPRSAPRRAQS
ncbi:MAG: CDP-alcohol phosphatidyltransferase family protein [Gemmatimonadaceae bacterium]|nr:CDP-alcohol phosphatidyltransferase family protein [Gemmatimonadaceae bacterium]